MSTPKDFTMENFREFWNSMQTQILPKYAKVDDLAKDLKDNVTKEDIVAILGYTPDNIPEEQEKMLDNMRYQEGQLQVKDSAGNWTTLVNNTTEEKNEYATQDDIDNLFK